MAPVSPRNSTPGRPRAHNREAAEVVGKGAFVLSGMASLYMLRTLLSLCMLSPLIGNNENYLRHVCLFVYLFQSTSGFVRRMTRGRRIEQFTNEMSELLCKDLRGKSLQQNRSKAGRGHRLCALPAGKRLFQA
jgi:hypothetical protein